MGFSRKRTGTGERRAPAKSIGCGSPEVRFGHWRVQLGRVESPLGTGSGVTAVELSPGPPVLRPLSAATAVAR